MNLFAQIYFLSANNCRTVLTVPSGTIRSNNYPNAYTSSSVCLWTVMAKEGTNVLLEVWVDKQIILNGYEAPIFNMFVEGIN